VGFALCLAVVLAAMGWVSLQVVRLDRQQAEARRRAALEENVRLALWRMDSALAPFIAQENARPYFSYTAFYPAERAYTRMFAELRHGEILVPSPLLTYASPYTLLHFQLGPDGEMKSPQAPTGNMRDLAETAYTTHEKIIAADARLQELRKITSRDTLLSALPASPTGRAAGSAAHVTTWDEMANPPAREAPAQAPSQTEKNVLELQARKQTYQQQEKAATEFSAASPHIGEGAMRPLWLGEALLLARRVSVGKQEYVQGCWLDWPAMRQWLLSSVRDLLPAADIVPLKGSGAESEASQDRFRLLAALPLRLVPGPLAHVPSEGMSPIWLSLLIAWGCAALAAIAVGVLLRGAVTLSERRGAFVSAVTHELRTPLTTFRLYTEMLAEGIAPEEKRQQYLATLGTEAERLSHLVENVLAYAQLEKGRHAERLETVTVEDLLDRVKGRLTQRAEQADMQLTVEADNTASPATIRTDTSAVEQILFNLVDNACKYAAAATDRRIHLRAERSGRFLALRVRDHGPGIAKSDARRLFRPFSKSARDAANSAPGVGLGLALSRRLARRATVGGGDLRLDEAVKDGASFVLTLPLA
jgi:signal transduction histidine kinase